MIITARQLRQFIREAIELDIEKGDVILTGKFKNKRTVVKKIGTDDLGQPTINGKSILKFRIEKHMPKEKWSAKSKEEAGLEEAKKRIKNKIREYSRPGREPTGPGKPVSADMPNMKEWWNEDPEDIMGFVYWTKGQIPPTDPMKRAAAWDRLAQQLEKRHPSPLKDSVIEKIIREVVNQDTIEIAGRAIKLAARQDIASEIQTARRSNAGRSYADTHALWAAEPGETPEQTVERLSKWASGNFPGGVTLYQDLETGEVFGHAKYNTF